MARFGHRPIDTLRPMEMESYKTDRLTKDKVSPETEVRMLAAFRRGVQWKELDFNPLEEIGIHGRLHRSRCPGGWQALLPIATGFRSSARDRSFGFLGLAFGSTA